MAVSRRLILVVALSTFAPALYGAEVNDTSPIPIVIKDATFPINSVASGTVTLTVVVEKDGRVSEARVLKSIPSLDEPSVRAARQWRFEPGRLNGRPVRSTASISFVYDRGLFRTVDKPRK